MQGGSGENKEKLEVSFSHARTTRKEQKQCAPSSLPTRFTRIRRAILSVGTPVCNLSTLVICRVKVTWTFIYQQKEVFEDMWYFRKVASSCEQFGSVFNLVNGREEKSELSPQTRRNKKSIKFAQFLIVQGNYLFWGEKYNYLKNRAKV